MSRSRAVALVAVATSLAACSGYARRGSAPASSSAPPVSYGSGIERPPVPGDPDFEGVLVVTVIDGATDEGFRGAFVRVRKGKEEIARVPTDRRGRARMRLTEGRYSISAVGCGETVIVDRATEAVADVKRKTELAGLIRVDSWDRRFRPTNSVIVHDEAPWDVGVRARVGLRIEDRCDFSVGEGGSLAGYRWLTTGAIAFAEDPPARAGPDGYAVVELRCRTSGDAEVTVLDPRHPADRVAILSSAQQPEGNRPWCGS